MVKSVHDISNYIEDQFPDIYKENGPNFIAFVKAYYEFVDINYSKHRDNMEHMDVDNTLNEYLKYFKSTYLKDFPFITASDTRFMVKHIMDFYKSKGTSLSTELLLRLVFGEESYIYKPSQDIFKPSDSKWVEPEYIEVERNTRCAGFINKSITGSKSGATAIVEGVVTKRLNGRYIDVLYISSPMGKFIKDEYVSDDGVLKNAPKVTGSLTTVTVTNGGRNNKVGDIFDVISTNGLQGKVRVSSVEAATGRVDFSIEDGGFGYTTTDATDVFVSDGVLFLKNNQLAYKMFEDVYQKIETLDLLSVDAFQNSMLPGNFLVGVNSSNTPVANGTIIENNYDGVTSNVKLLVTSGTFDTQRKLTLNNTTGLLVGEYVEEESDLDIVAVSNTTNFSVGNRIEQVAVADFGEITGTLVVSSVTGTFVDGETVIQNNIGGNLVISAVIEQIISSTNFKIKGMHKYAAPRSFVTGVQLIGLTSGATATLSSYTSGGSTALYTNYAYGTVSAITGQTISVNSSWGSFDIGAGIKVYANSTSNTIINESNMSSIVYNNTGARGKLTSKVGADIVVEDILGDFTTTKKIRGSKSKIIKTISSIVDDGASDVRVNGNVGQIGVIDVVANTSPFAKVIGQNTTSIGIYGNSTPFYSSGDINLTTTRRFVAAVVVDNNDIASIETNVNHIFVAGEYVNLILDIQIANEVFRLYGVYEVLTTPTANTFTIQFDGDYADKIRQDFSIFDTSVVQKTILINVETSRSTMYDPPRNSNGDIIEISSSVYDISSGVGAGFEIGTLENEETVFLNTDFVSDENVANVSYLDMLIDGSNSGIGFVDSVDVITAGSGYSNGLVISFEGGGYGNGEPVIKASGIVTTNGSGGITYVTITSHGQGYFTSPTAIVPNSTVNAVLSPSMDYGYGFIKAPNGDIDTLIEDVLTSEEFTIGTITGLSKINPGSEYNANPYVNVYNSAIAGYGRADFVINLSSGAGGFSIGENIIQEIPGDGGSISFAKGYVLSSNNNQLIIRRTSFSVSFTTGYNIVGQSTGSIGVIDSVEMLANSYVAGENASIVGTAISANGIAKTLEVVDSGFGYEDLGEVTLVSDNSPFVVTGVSNVKNHGKGSGSWHTETSHLNGVAKLHDNYYYQEYAYEVVSGKSLEQYERVLKNILHVAGSKMFGKVEKRNSLLSTVGLGSSGLSYTNITPEAYIKDIYLDSVGPWYDMRNATYLFTDDSASTLANELGDKVGLVLDRSREVIAQPELIPNYKLKNATGWTTINSTFTTASRRGKVYSANTSAGAKMVRQSIGGLVVGKYYKFTTILYYAGGDGVDNAFIKLYDSGETTQLRSVSSVGIGYQTITMFFKASETTHVIGVGFIANGAVDASNYIEFSNPSIKLYDGYHAYQLTEEKKPMLVSYPMSGRRNILSNSADMTVAPWAIPGANIVASGTINGEIAFDISDDATVLWDEEGYVNNITDKDDVCFSIKVPKSNIATDAVAVRFNITQEDWETAHCGVIIDQQTGLLLDELTWIDDNRLIDRGVIDGGNHWVVYVSAEIFATDILTHIQLVPVYHNGADVFYGMTIEGVKKYSSPQLEYAGYPTAYQRVVSDVEIYEVGVESAFGITFDGVDDSLETDIIDWNSSEFTIGAVAHNIGHINENRHVVSFGDNPLTDLGVFDVSLDGDIKVTSKGTLSRSLTVPTSNPPKQLIVATANLMTDQIVLHYNNVDYDLIEDMGPSTYTSEKMYIGSQGNGSYFNGTLYNIITTNKQLEKTRLWVVEECLRNQYDL